jgi:NifU-like protein involved in Fe-S cluster formation
MASGMTIQPLYTVDILRLAADLGEPNALERVDGRAEVRSPTCGSRIDTSVQVEGGRLTAMSQAVQACAFGQAASALVERSAVGRSLAEIEAAQAGVAEWLSGSSDEVDWGFTAIAPARKRSGRHGAILLPFRALIAAMEAAR